MPWFRAAILCPYTSDLNLPLYAVANCNGQFSGTMAIREDDPFHFAHP